MKGHETNTIAYNDDFATALKKLSEYQEPSRQVIENIKQEIKAEMQDHEGQEGVRICR